jgi:hypothetical protein
MRTMRSESPRRSPAPVARRIRSLWMDERSEEDADALVGHEIERFGRLDGAVNNAGVETRGNAAARGTHRRLVTRHRSHARWHFLEMRAQLGYFVGVWFGRRRQRFTRWVQGGIRASLVCCCKTRSHWAHQPAVLGVDGALPAPTGLQLYRRWGSGAWRNRRVTENRVQRDSRQTQISTIT